MESGERLTIELTDYADYLPPDVGADQWFAHVQTDRDGAVTSFTIDKGGVTYGGSGLWRRADRKPAVHLLRAPSRRPRGHEHGPTDASPGDVDLPVVIRMTNNGASTAGPVTGILTSTDPHLTLSEATELTIDADVWEKPRRTNSPDHWPASPPTTSSTPVRANLEMTDGADTWNVPVDVQVPWPVLEVIVTTVDDADGILSDGESAELQLEIANMGALFRSENGHRDDPFPAVDGDGHHRRRHRSAQPLDPGETDGIDVELSGVGRRRRAPRARMSQSPTRPAPTRWRSRFPSVSPPGPPSPPQRRHRRRCRSGGRTFDFVNGRYRVKDGQIEVILESAAAYDPATLFIESWGISSGALCLLSVGLQRRRAQLPGLRQRRGWQPAGTLTVVELSSTEVMLSWPIEDMETITTNLSLGFASPVVWRAHLLL